MRKTSLLYFTILLISQLNFIKNEGCEKSNPSNEKECHNRPAGEGNYKCCYVEEEWKGGKEISCGAVTKKEYDNIDDLIDKYEDLLEAAGYKDPDISVDCSSKYLLISLLSLILLFI